MRQHTSSARDPVALVLQGGGALGAFQVGVFQALDEAGYAPDWFAGTSIGAINSAIMAGNPPERRLQRLDQFWSSISRIIPLDMFRNGTRHWARAWSAWQTAVFGQPGFFRWRPINPWLAIPGSAAAISYYDPSELGRTLESLIDLDLINKKAIRLSLGAVNIGTGRQVYFDSRSQQIGLAHILASAALPPAFPPVEIDGEWYWDGGLVSNTPLDVIIDDEPRRSTLCFMVDLFDGAGPTPRTMEEVEARRKEITYASRSDRSIEAHHVKHDLRRAVTALWKRLPPEAQQDAHLRELSKLGCTTTMRIVHLTHRNEPDELATKDYEFSATSIHAHKEAGYRDAKRMLEEQPWQRPVSPDVGVVVYGVPTETAT